MRLRMEFVIFTALIVLIVALVLLAPPTGAQEVTDSIYRIRTPDGAAGTAFVLHTDRERSILGTASHVTQYKEIKTQMYAGNAYTIENAKGSAVAKAACIAMDIEVDIALVQTDKPVEGPPFQIITDVDDYVFGRTNVTPGPDYYPKKIMLRIRGYADGFKETIGFYSFTYKDNLMADAAALPGQSGGPIVLDDKVVGVLSGGHSWYEYGTKDEPRSATWPVRGGSGRRLQEMLRDKLR